MKILQKIFYFFFSFVTLASFVQNVSANTDNDTTKKVQSIPPEILLWESGQLHSDFIELPNQASGSGIVEFLEFIQVVLLKIALPLVAIGVGLYIAYILFSASGDEEKMKKVWSAVVYAIIGFISIALSYFVVDLISRINI